MDPATHALIGLGVSALSGQPLSPYNPANCAAVTGAVLPDLDVIALLKGELSFLKHHRGASHSWIGLLFVSTLAALITFVDFGGNFWSHFGWGLAGAVSHGILDFLNSYGIRPWWPLKHNLLAGNLLMFFDPLIFAFFAPVPIFFRSPQKAAIFALWGSMLYLLLRRIIRQKVKMVLRRNFNLNPERDKMIVMPSQKGLLNWDFIIKSPYEIIVGRIGSLNRKISNCRFFVRKDLSPLAFKALQSPPGKLFCNFTTSYHVTQWEEKGKHFIKLMDLRFRNKADFFYRAMLIFNEKEHLEKAFFYRRNSLIPIDPG